ncbi:hypothetical protein COB11_00225 [Candidatus Aerophobetes bacterium]|uniref:PsbP C-terminal domain-containing protein n=1 Tax=Aerophobetes bacterium TaxID=2030807 RepID=A0A2A4YNT3_UNCAE|nr:MAG: hypothetical protein COB11_00225 [Candidatus Aerophobetes bacterium]
MNNFFKTLLTLRVALVALLLSFTAIGVSGIKGEAEIVPVVSKRNVSNKEDLSSWKKFHSVTGKCVVSFPGTPEHVKQTMNLEDDEYNMQYDVYVATEQDKQAVYMVLIAQYPPYVNESYAELSLESFLNGILTQHPNNQLVFADLTEVQGHKAMDFFIKTKGVFFKGRAIMAGSNLYLLAMECEGENFKENQFKYFIDSFELTK